MAKYIRIPGAGEFRGEGRWMLVVGDKMESDFIECVKTGHLPVARSIDDWEDERDDRGKTPRFVRKDNQLIHQPMKLVLSIPDPQDDYKLRWAHLQLTALVNTVRGTGDF